MLAEGLSFMKIPVILSSASQILEIGKLLFTLKAFVVRAISKRLAYNC